MPFLDYLFALGLVATGAHDECNSLVVQGDGRLRFPLGDGHEVSASPEVVTFPLDEPAGRFPRLASQFLFPIINPAQLGDRVCADNIKPRRDRRHQCYAANRRVDRQMDVLDVLPRHLNRNFSELNRLLH